MRQTEPRPRVAHSDLAIVGATATGKTALALSLSSAIEGFELVSVDSMAVYAGMDIGTESPVSPPEWHLVDIADPAVEFSVAEFQAAAHRAVAGTRARGHRPLYVGGTGLYHRAVLDGLELPARYPEIAAELERQAATPSGLLRLYQRLEELDAPAAARIEPGNRRRIVRALEVCLGSGRGFSSFGPGLAAYGQGSARLVGLALERGELDRRLASRLSAEIGAGWIDEVRRLASRRGGLSRTARQAIGYAELLQYLAGDMQLDEAEVVILKRLKSFARRQESWFRRDPRVVWFGADAPNLAEEVMEWYAPMAHPPGECETGAQ